MVFRAGERASRGSGRVSGLASERSRSTRRSVISKRWVSVEPCRSGRASFREACGNGLRSLERLQRSPRLLFLDEPFSALDALTRATLQQVLAQMCSEAGKSATAIMITNNLDEALLLSDQIVPMTRGPRSKLGTPIPVTLPRPRTDAQLLHDPHGRTDASGSRGAARRVCSRRARRRSSTKLRRFRSVAEAKAVEEQL